VPMYGHALSVRRTSLCNRQAGGSAEGQPQLTVTALIGVGLSKAAYRLGRFDGTRHLATGVHKKRRLDAAFPASDASRLNNSDLHGRKIRPLASKPTGPAQTS
jgi:hypothetical protein